MALNAKKRVNISISKDIDNILIKLSKRDEVPVAAKVLELLKKALQLEEDAVLEALARERDAKKTEYLSHERAWRRLL